MKLSFKVKTKIVPISNKNIPIYIDNVMYSQYNNSIILTDIETSKILRKIDFEEILCFDVYEEYIVIGNTNIQIYSLKEDRIIKSIAIGKININNVRCCTGVNDLIVTRIDGNVFYCSDEVCVVTKFDGLIRIHLSEDRTACIYDNKKINLFYNGKIVLEKHIESIVSVYFHKFIYIVTGDKKLVKIMENNVIVSTDASMSNILVLDDTVVCTDNRFLYFYNLDLYFVKKKSFFNEFNLEKYSTRKNEVVVEEGHKSFDESFNNGNADCEDIPISNFKDKFIITYFSKSFILSSEHEIFLLDDNLNCKYVFIGNNDEITEIKEIEDTMFVATNSGRLRYTYKSMYESGEFVFKGYVVEGHSEVIMSLSIYNNMLLTTSQDSFVNLYRLSTDEKSKLKRIKISSEINQGILKEMNTFYCGSVHQNSCALSDEFFVVGGDDGIIQFWNYRENTITIKIHKKEINSISIHHGNKMIATGSQDKEVKLLDFQGKILTTLYGHRKGVVCVCFGIKYLASSSIDKTVRIWDIKTYECIAVLEGHDSGVLKCEFYKDEKYLISTSVSGVIKIWDVKKKRCEQSLDIHKDKIWALSITTDGFIFGTNGFIYFLKDDTKNKNVELLEEENKKALRKLELDKCIKEDNYLKLFELLKDTKEYNLMFKGMIKVYENKKYDILNVFKDSKKTFYQMIISNYKFKNSEVISWMIKFAFNNNWYPPKDMIEEVDKILMKQIDGIEIIYRDLISYDIFNK